MNLLSKDINTISFEDVVTFCRQGVLEWTQLDYKLSIPRDLAKHFATFSNTKGGLIIIGVKENAKGLPASYKGVPNDGKLVDQIHQIAANVTPLPTYDVCLTNEKAGNVFILIRISEGAAAPYSTLSDPTVWIRNGNISAPASRDELILLSNKRADADRLRFNQLASATQYFQNRLKAAEIERKSLIARKKPDIYGSALGGENSATLTISFMPHYPSKNLVEPRALIYNEHEYLGKEYPSTLFANGTSVTMPGGLSVFSWNERRGVFRNDQIHTNGLSYTSADVLQVEDGKKQLSARDIAHKLRSQLAIIRHFYSKTGYSGLIEGIIELNGGSGATVTPIESDKHFLYRPDRGNVYMPSHHWLISLDTSQLSNNESLSSVFAGAVRDVSWGLGAGDIPDEIMNRFLEINGW